MPSYGSDLERLAARWSADPQSTCFAALADGLRKAGALSEAATVAAQGVATHPDYLPGYLVQARVCSDQGQWDAARDALLIALGIDPGHPVVLEHLQRLPSTDAPEVAPMLLPRSTQAVTLEAGDPVVALAPLDEPPEPVEESQLPPEPLEESQLMYAEPLDVRDEPAETMVFTESLALLFHGQGHLDEAIEVLDALVARQPSDDALRARRDAWRAERDALRPRPYHVDRSGGQSVRQWLAGIARVQTASSPPPSSLDEFYQPPPAPVADRTDLAAFQAWLKELDR